MTVIFHTTNVATRHYRDIHGRDTRICGAHGYCSVKDKTNGESIKHDWGGIQIRTGFEIQTVSSVNLIDLLN